MDDPLTHLAQFTYFLFERWEGLSLLGLLVVLDLVSSRDLATPRGKGLVREPVAAGRHVGGARAIDAASGDGGLAREPRLRFPSEPTRCPADDARTASVGG